MKRTTYADKIGLPPGSLVSIGREREQEVTVSEINFSPNQYEEVVLLSFTKAIQHIIVL